MLFNEYPYINLQDLNLDYILMIIKKIRSDLDDFVNLNTIKYADPINWDITKQYETNTIVVDPYDGTAYISVRPIPVGVSITNTEYWSPIFNYGDVIENIKSNIASNELHSPTATHVYTKDSLVWFNDELYKTIVDIPVGTAFIVNQNIVKCTVEEFINIVRTALDNEITARTNADAALQTTIDNEITARTNADTALQTTIDNEITARTNADTALQTNINALKFINVNNAGIASDTDVDVYNALFDLLQNTAEGTTVYFPAGTYIISDTLPIKAGMTICGEGDNTIINFTGDYGYWGVGLLVAGDNVTIRDIKINSPVYDTITPSAMLGAIGVSTAKASSFTDYHYASDAVRENRSNVTIKNVSSDGSYLIQTENENSELVIKNVTYDHLRNEAGKVSILGGTGAIENVTINHVICDVLRIGDGSKLCKNITINDCTVKFCNLSETNIKVNNLVVDNTTDSKADFGNRALIVASDNIIINGLKMFGGDSKFVVAIALSNGTSFISNAYISGYDVLSRYTSGSVVCTQFLTNCYMQGNGTATTHFNGFANHCVINNQSEKNLITDSSKHQVSLNLGSNADLSPTYPSKIIATGNTCSVFMALVMNNTSLIATIADSKYINTDARISGIAWDSAGTTTYPVTVKMNASGELDFIINAVGVNPSSCNRLLLNGTYTISNSDFI